MSAPRTVRFAAVGCGRVFQRYHLPCVTARTDVELVGVCDLEVGRAREILTPDHPDVWVGTGLTEMIEQTRPDVISVCTPNDQHAAPVRQALDAGIAVLCEKPLAARIEDARVMAADARPGRLLGLNLPYRFYDLVLPFAAAVSGADGFEMEFSTAGDRIWRPYTPWYHDISRSGGGALLDLGIHALDLLLAVFGSAVVSGCRIDAPVVEQQAEVELSCGSVPGVLRIDRTSRRLAVRVTARTSTGEQVLDLRRGTAELAGDAVVSAMPRPELAAIAGFLDLVTGHDSGRIVSPASALEIQELVEVAYRYARDEYMPP